MADGICECGHAKADHLRGIGCCVDPLDEDCGCGIFRPDDADPLPPHEWLVQITTADGRGSFCVRAAPDATPEVRDALHAIAQEAYRRLEHAGDAHPDDDAIRRVAERLRANGDHSRTVVLADGSFGRVIWSPP